jgi:hypothetical protein
MIITIQRDEQDAPSPHIFKLMISLHTILSQCSMSRFGLRCSESQGQKEVLGPFHTNVYEGSVWAAQVHI